MEPNMTAHFFAFFVRPGAPKFSLYTGTLASYPQTGEHSCPDPTFGVQPPYYLESADGAIQR